MEGFEYTALHITQHKRFVPNGTQPNFCFAKTSFMLKTLYEMAEKEINIWTNQKPI